MFNISDFTASKENSFGKIKKVATGRKYYHKRIKSSFDLNQFKKSNFETKSSFLKAKKAYLDLREQIGVSHSSRVNDIPQESQVNVSEFQSGEKMAQIGQKLSMIRKKSNFLLK